MCGAKGDPVENARGEPGGMDNRTETTELGNVNRFSSLNGHYDRDEDTEKDIDRGEQN